jgi:hypothetical protein
MLGRPASEKRRGTKSAGSRGTVGAAGSMGIWPAASGWTRLHQGAPSRFPCGVGVGDGLERIRRALPDRVGGATAGRFVNLQ